MGQLLDPQTVYPPSMAGNTLRRYAPKVGAECGKAARTVLCGGRSAMSVPTAIASLAAVIARERAGEEYRPHPEELAKQASRRMDATYGLTAILRDARKSALLRMRSEIFSQTALVVVDQHPADGGEPDDDSERDRPSADADVADGSPFGFVLRDFTIPLLVF